MKLNLHKKRLLAIAPRPVRTVVRFLGNPLKVIVRLCNLNSGVFSELLIALQKCLPRQIIDVVAMLMKQLGNQRDIGGQLNDMAWNARTMVLNSKARLVPAGDQR